MCIYIYIYINRSLSPLSFHSIFLNTSLSLSLINSKSPITQTIARIYQDIKKTTIYGRQSNEIYHCFFNPFKSLIFSPMVSYSSIFGQVSNLVQFYFLVGFDVQTLGFDLLWILMWVLISRFESLEILWFCELSSLFQSNFFKPKEPLALMKKKNCTAAGQRTNLRQSAAVPVMEKPTPLAR